MDHVYGLLNEISQLSFAIQPHNRTMMIACMKGVEIFFTSSLEEEVYHRVKAIQPRH